jgi:hypothetical protein
MLAAGARVLGSGVAAAAATLVVIVVAVLFPTAVGETADVTADATEPTTVVRAVRATDLGFTAAVVVALVVIIVTLGERHLVHPVVEHTLVVRPEPRLVVHCPEHIGRRRQGERR